MIMKYSAGTATQSTYATVAIWRRSLHGWGDNRKRRFNCLSYCL